MLFFFLFAIFATCLSQPRMPICDVPPRSYVEVGVNVFGDLGVTFEPVEFMLADSQDARASEHLIKRARDTGVGCCQRNTAVFCSSDHRFEPLIDPIMCATRPQGYIETGEVIAGSLKPRDFELGDSDDERQATALIARSEKALHGAHFTDCCMEFSHIMYCKSEAFRASTRPHACLTYSTIADGFIETGTVSKRRTDGERETFRPREFELGDSDDARQADSLIARSKKAMQGDNSQNCCVNRHLGVVLCKSAAFRRLSPSSASSTSSQTTNLDTVACAEIPSGYIETGRINAGKFFPREYMLGDSQDAQEASKLTKRSRLTLKHRTDQKCCVKLTESKTYCESQAFSITD